MTAPTFPERYGPYALVLGGSYGLGAAYAEALARRGLSLVLLARQEEPLRATATRLQDAYGVDVIALVGDVSDYRDVEQRLRGLDVAIGLVVYDAAYAPVGRFQDMSEDQLVRLTEVNVRGPLLLARALAGPMIERGRGGIILMSSLAGSLGSPNLAAYAATKSFNAILAEGLWRELRPQGVDVLACMAGAILTPGYQEAGGGKPAPGTMPARDVAEQALRALGKGPIVIPGGMNKLARFLLMRLLPRRAAIGVMARNTGGLS